MCRIGILRLEPYLTDGRTNQPTPFSPGEILNSVSLALNAHILHIVCLLQPSTHTHHSHLPQTHTGRSRVKKKKKKLDPSQRRRFVLGAREQKKPFGVPGLSPSSSICGCVNNHQRLSSLSLSLYLRVFSAHGRTWRRGGGAVISGR